MTKYVEFGCVECPEHGYQMLTWEQYDVQMDNPGDFWRCPICNVRADWIDQDDVDYDDSDHPPF